MKSLVMKHMKTNITGKTFSVLSKIYKMENKGKQKESRDIKIKANLANKHV